jgi:hypothetical protein
MRFMDYIEDALPAFQFLIDDYGFVLAEKRVDNTGHTWHIEKMGWILGSI